MFGQKMKEKQTVPLLLNNIEKERITLDKLFLEIIGFNKKEIEKVLPELYKFLHNIVSGRLLKAQSLKGVKTQRNKVEFSVYVEQLKEMLIDGKIDAKNTFKFAKQLEKLVREISSESKLQKKILDTYWKEKFGELFDEKEIANRQQQKLF